MGYELSRVSLWLVVLLHYATCLDTSIMRRRALMNEDKDEYDEVQSCCEDLGVHRPDILWG